MIKKLKLFFKWANTPKEDMAEIHELIVKSARRCAYDLKHTITTLYRYDEELAEFYDSRCDIWLNIFENDAGKKYRHDLHKEISRLNGRIKFLENILNEHNIDYSKKDDIPF